MNSSHLSVFALRSVALLFVLFVVSANAGVSPGPSLPELNGQSNSAPPKASVILPSTQYNLVTDVAAIAHDLGTPVLPATSSSRPYQIGVGRPVLIQVPAQASHFRNADGTEIMLLKIKSPGALGLRLRFIDFNVGVGDAVYVYGPGHREKIDGPYRGRGVWNDGEFWTGTIEGDTAIVEYHAKGAPGAFTIAAVSHIFRGLENPSIDGLVLFCEVDASCSAVGPKNAVGRISFVRNGSTYLCSGTLLNNANNDRTPYFLTAAHCVDSQAIARTVEVYWLYQTTACNSMVLRSDGSSSSGGADLLSTGVVSDYSLLRFLLPAPANVSFAGWNVSTLIAGASAYGLHHPGPGLPPEEYSHLRRSEGVINSTNSNQCAQGYKVIWSSGTVEGGSSGSGLFLPGSNALVGVLSCGSLDGICAQSSAWYGKLLSFYPSIERFLDPPATIPLNTALDGSQLTWSTGGATPWQGQDRTTHDGIDAAMSGALLANQESWVQTTVAGPGTLTFWWRVSSLYTQDDYLRFRLNGLELTTVPALSGVTDWRRVAVQIPAGTNTLRWTYSKGQTPPNAGEDTAWLDQVSLVGANVAPDFNSDGNSDIVLQNNGTGQRAVWLMNGTAYTGALSLPTAALQWQIASTGDFNGDGNVDIVWQNTSTGQRAVWFMNGTTYVGVGSLPTVSIAWQIVGTGDFNGDGQTDMVWQNSNTGQRAVWFMNQTSLSSTRSLPTVALAWQIAGTGDFNGDGQVDLVWQNSNTGQRAIWLMNGTTLVGTRPLPTTALAWQIAGTGEYNGDGQVDLIWQNAVTGQRAIWLMNGSVLATARSLPTLPTQWEIRNH